MGLRAKLILAGFVVALLGVGTSLFAAERYLASNARLNLTSDLERGAALYKALDEERTARRVAEARVLADEPRLKAVIRTSDIDQATLDDVADDVRAAAGADLFALTDRMGVIVSDVSTLKLGKELTQRAGVATAVSAGGGEAIWAHGGALYRVVIRALKFGAEVSGLLVVGHRIGDPAAVSAAQNLGVEVVLVLDQKVVAAGLGDGRDRAVVANALAGAAEGIGELDIGGERFVTYKGRYPGVAIPGARVVMARSLDEALSRHAAVRRRVIAIGATTLVIAFVAAIGLGRSLTRRIQDLSKAARQISGGDLRVRVVVDGVDEVAGLGADFNSMALQLEKSQEGLIRKERLEKELQIAQRIQTALLPRTTVVSGYNISGCCVPAESVGGDFYDVLPDGRGSFWLFIGDVTSHGVTPGLIMMMAQSATAALVASQPDAPPADLLVKLNRVLYTNIHDRLQDDNHMTFCAMHHAGDGTFVFAGAHLDVLIRRGASGPVERVPTPGVWLGLVADVAGMLEQSQLKLEIGDLMLLYSDGLTEARSASGAMFDVPAVEAILRDGGGPTQTKDRLLAAVRKHQKVQVDDITIVAVERRA